MPSASTLILCCAIIAMPSHAFLVFVVDQTSERFPVELAPDATIKELRDEIVRIKQVNEDEYHIAISFQGKEFTNLDVALADTGVCNQCTLSVQFIKYLIPIQFVDGNKQKHNLDDVLQWDTREDITQFARMYNKKKLFITFRDQHGEWIKSVAYKSLSEPTRSHSFWIVRNGDDDGTQQRQEVFAQLPPGVVVHTAHLQSKEYAKDILVTPPLGHTMDLDYTFLSLQSGRYRFPVGYALLLKHKNTTYPCT